MKLRPILFNGAMVRALLDGSKTQTRRAVKSVALDWIEKYKFTPEFVADPANMLCKFGGAGDQLWVRETWQYYDWTEDGIPCIRFAADNQTMWAANADESAVAQWEILSAPENYNIDNRARDRKWRPSIHMPRWASRIALEITSVRVERLNVISEADARAEGIDIAECVMEPTLLAGKAVFRRLWEAINGEGSWEANPWVWVIEFKRVEQ